MKQSKKSIASPTPDTHPPVGGPSTAVAVEKQWGDVHVLIKVGVSVGVDVCCGDTFAPLAFRSWGAACHSSS